MSSTTRCVLLLFISLLCRVSSLSVTPVRNEYLKQSSGRHLLQQPSPAAFPPLPSPPPTCGSINSRCCPNDLCNAGATCLQTGATKKCEQCGLQGHPCCNGSCLDNTNKCALQGNQFKCIKSLTPASADSNEPALISPSGGESCGTVGLPCCNGVCSEGICKESKCINWQVTSFTSFSSVSQVQGPARTPSFFGRIG